MQLTREVINCQEPADTRNITREHHIIRCSIAKGSEEYNALLEKANALAALVNAGAANNSGFDRNLLRRQKDSFGGLLAEAGWEQYINSTFDNIASPTPFTSASVQIDINLTNGEKVEIRSSFPRNGVKFALCHDHYNFRNIGPYSNSIKAGEIQKHLYLAVLFDTPKDSLLDADTVTFSLVGGSTWARMIEAGYNTDLIPENDSFATRSNYRVVDLKNALDTDQVVDAIANLNYNRR
jgi:hypothetical protein